MSNINIGKRLKSLNIGKKLPYYTGVSIQVGQDSAGVEVTYTAGDDTGYVLELVNPLGTQAMADNILASLKLRGVRYQPFEASGARLDPAAEMGDAVTVNGTVSYIASQKRSFGRIMLADISAPYDEEVNHEYKYEPKTQREFKRESAYTRSRLTIAEDAIEAKVSKTSPEGQESFSWRLVSDSHTWYANDTMVMRVNRNGLRIEGEIYATSGRIGDAVIENGHLTIDGASIRNLNADYITVGTLNVDRIANGSIGGADGNGKIQASSLSTYNTNSGINTNLGYAAGYHTNTTTNNPTLYPDYFKAGTIRAANALVVAGYGFVRGTPFVVNGITHYCWEYQS